MLNNKQLFFVLGLLILLIGGGILFYSYHTMTNNVPSIQKTENFSNAVLNPKFKSELWNYYKKILAFAPDHKKRSEQLSVMQHEDSIEYRITIELFDVLINNTTSFIEKIKNNNHFYIQELEIKKSENAYDIFFTLYAQEFLDQENQILRTWPDSVCDRIFTLFLGLSNKIDLNKSQISSEKFTITEDATNIEINTSAISTLPLIQQSFQNTQNGRFVVKITLPSLNREES